MSEAIHPTATDEGTIISQQSTSKDSHFFYSLVQGDPLLGFEEEETAALEIEISSLLKKKEINGAD